MCRITVAGVLVLALAIGGCQLIYDDRPELMAFFQAIPPEGAPPLRVLFDASGSVGAEEWHWDFGDGSYGEGEVVSHVYGEVGEYHVILTVRGRGEEDSAWRRIVVREYDPVAAFSMAGELSGPGNEFIGGEIVFFDASASYDPDGAIVSYRWDFGDGTTAEGPQVTHWWPGPSGCGPDDYLTFIVTLWVEDDDGRRSFATAEVKIWCASRR